MAPRSVPRPPSILADAYLARRPGIVMERLPDGLLARAKRERLHVRLNETAALLWMLCNGRERLSQISERVGQLYPADIAQVGDDVAAGLADLRTRRLIQVSPKQYPVRPLLRVGFCNFWHRFDGRDNYFTWMLTHRFDVILVDPRTDTPDLIFYSTHVSADFDHRRIQRSQTRKILFTGGSPDFSECDFAFTTRPVDDAPADRHQQLPLWSLYVDWDHYQRCEAGFYDDQIFARCHPLEVCNRLYDLLLGEGDAAAESRNPSPTGRPPMRPNREAVPALAVTPASAPAAGKKLTIGMATFDDYDGVYFTVQALRLFHPDVTADTEILVVDNNPDGPCAPPLQALGGWVEGYRYVPSREAQGTAARDLVFREAQTPYTLCVDSHVLLAPGALRQLIDYLDSHPACLDLLQGPLVHDDLKTLSTHFDPIWSDGMWGVWGKDPRGAATDNQPFEIQMQGLGVFACRRAAWLGFNPRFLGFGGEEGYIHEKFRQAGRRTLCLPFLRWTHRFHRPFGARYRNTWEDRIRNYFIGADELGLDSGAMEAHFRQRMGADDFERLESAIREEMGSPFFYFDAIYCINRDAAVDRWKLMEARFTRLGILHRVRRFSAVETPESQRIGWALSHRRILEQAKKQGLEHVLVFEDDAMFLEDCLTHLKRSVDELRSRPWEVFHLGGWSAEGRPALGCNFLERPCPNLTCTNAIAYHSRMYQRLLDDLPAEVDSLGEWIATHLAIDDRYVSRPAVSSQPNRLRLGPPGHADRFF